MNFPKELRGCVAKYSILLWKTIIPDVIIMYSLKIINLV